MKRKLSDGLCPLIPGFRADIPARDRAAASGAFDRDKLLNRQEKISDLDEADAVAIGPLVNVTKT
jgi:hypothetical protein